MTTAQFEINGKEAQVDLYYPRGEDSQDTVVVALYDVRAADDLRISYDFSRDGWSIKREVHTPGKDDEEPFVETGLWIEAAFIPAWTMGETSG